MDHAVSNVAMAVAVTLTIGFGAGVAVGWGVGNGAGSGGPDGAVALPPPPHAAANKGSARTMLSRQGFCTSNDLLIWRKARCGFAEVVPRLSADLMRRVCGVARADASWATV